LHVDGSHLLVPPDVVVLSALTPSPTGTLVVRPQLPTAGAAADPYRQGVFTVRGGKKPFLSVIYDGRRLRFDPGCMSPSDSLARQGAESIEAHRPSAHLHVWDRPNLLLFIDNRRALHAREAVIEGDEGRAVERLQLLFEENR
jgi:hypothetical protein